MLLIRIPIPMYSQLDKDKEEGPQVMTLLMTLIIFNHAVLHLGLHDSSSVPCLTGLTIQLYEL